jgi:hypothetical protein
VTPNQAKALGYRTEVLIVEWLRGHGWPFAERRRLRGARDQGDVTGCPGLAIEVKSSFAKVSEALTEAERERDHAGADYGLVVMRRRGKPDPAGWYCVMPFGDVVRLLHTVGYGDADV